MRGKLASGQFPKKATPVHEKIQALPTEVEPMTFRLQVGRSTTSYRRLVRAARGVYITRLYEKVPLPKNCISQYRVILSAHSPEKLE